MTTGKPPQLPQKTRFGQPDDPREVAQKPAPAPDLQRTLYGNPHAAPAPGSARPPASSDRPRLPQSQPFQPPPLPPRSQPAPVQVQPPVTYPPAEQSSRPGDLNRTHYGAKPDLDAAARQARAVVAAANAASPQPAPHQQATQYSPRPGIGAAAGSAAAGSVRPNQTVVLKDASQPSAAESSRPAAEPASARPAAWAPAPAPAPAQPQQPASAAPAPEQSGAANSAQPSPVIAPAQPSVVKPVEQFISTEPDRERDSKRPQPGVPSVRLMPQAATSLPPSAAPNPMQATRLVTFEGGALPAGSTASGTPSPLSATPQLSLDADEINARKGATGPAAVKRWPALSLLAIAVLAFGGVIAVRAPGLLPPPLIPYAMLLSSQVERFFPGSVVSPSAANPQTEPAAAAPAVDPSQPPAAPVADPQPQPAQPPTAAPDVATQQAPEAPAAAPQPSAPAAPPAAAVAPAAAAPAALHGGSAELEKQAIELLLANDYAAARAVYERLRAAEPTHPEYAVMLELLMREITPSCGGEGQAPCPQ